MVHFVRTCTANILGRVQQTVTERWAGRDCPGSCCQPRRDATSDAFPLIAPRARYQRVVWTGSIPGAFHVNNARSTIETQTPISLDVAAKIGIPVYGGAPSSLARVYSSVDLWGMYATYICKISRQKELNCTLHRTNSPYGSPWGRPN